MLDGCLFRALRHDRPGIAPDTSADAGRVLIDRHALHERESGTAGRTDTDVTVTEVTDPAVKHQVVIAYAAEKPVREIASKHLKGQSMLVALGLAKGDTPEGLAAQCPTSSFSRSRRPRRCRQDW